MARRASPRGQARTVKTYVCDASALFGFLQKRAAANKVNELLKNALRGRADILMSAVNYGEVYGGNLHPQRLGRAGATLSAVDSFPIRLIQGTPPGGVLSGGGHAQQKPYYMCSLAS